MFSSKQVISSGLAFALLLASCSALETESNFPVVERSFISSVLIDWNVFALSPDGEAVIDASFIETNLETGVQTRRFRDTTGRLYELGGSGGFMGWSIDGRYLAATQVVYARDSTIIDRPVVIIDIETNSARYYPGAFNGWSAVNGERFMTNNWTPTNVSDGSEVHGWGTIDFREVAVKGNGSFLWDASQNVPIALISADPVVSADGIQTGTQILEINSFDSGRTIQVPIYSESPTQKTVNWIFDPSGRYVLLTIWERSEVPAEGNDEMRGKFVIDTVLILVDWRTQEQVELFRLSSIDPGNVVASLGGAAWSADGSTIFIPRNDAPAIVLKIKSP